MRDGVARQQAMTACLDQWTDTRASVSEKSMSAFRLKVEASTPTTARRATHRTSGTVPRPNSAR